MTDTRSVVLERELRHAPEKIWRALTEGALIKEWLMDNDLRAVVGHRFHFRSRPMPNWDGLIACEVLTVEPASKLSYSWNALGLESVVEWTLVPTSGGTLVRMEHSGFRADQEAAYKGATYGWQKFMGGLEEVVAGMDKAGIERGGCL
ncbi:MAG: SRPBCC domain-containing protein [Acidobacteriota bacterium]|nr:SRPBCC domain-containing protein [Acidobacteriota bacterium]